MEPQIVSQDLILTRVHLQLLRGRLLVTLNRIYPKRLEFQEVRCLHPHIRRNSITRELAYLRELGFLHKRDKRWRITAAGRDFLLGLVEAKGVAAPEDLGNIGER